MLVSSILFFSNKYIQFVVRLDIGFSDKNDSEQRKGVGERKRERGIRRWNKANGEAYRQTIIGILLSRKILGLRLDRHSVVELQRRLWL